MSYQYILFDLDGTLSNPEEGITKSVKYALEDQGIIENDQELLKLFIGPPLLESFMKYYGMSEEQAELAVKKYRERFSTVGLFENEIFPDTMDTLSYLKQKGYKIALATSKPYIFATRILEHFHIQQYFDVVKGAYEKHNDKADIIQDVLDEISDPDLTSYLMVGDRKHDIIGANKNKIDVVGLNCGFAPIGELEEYGATYILDTLSNLKELL